MARLLEKVENSGLPLLLRSDKDPTIAVKGRAIANNGSTRMNGFAIGNISDRGIEFLSKHSNGAIQVEFILTSEKVKFSTMISHLGRQQCVVDLPRYLESFERRKNSRFDTMENERAFVSVDGMAFDPGSLLSPPTFISTRKLGEMIAVGDISSSGLGLVSRFPFVSNFWSCADQIHPASLYLPMTAAIPLQASIRWTKKVTESSEAADGQIRSVSSYKFGLQFINPSEILQKSIHVFIQRLSHADAI